MRRNRTFPWTLLPLLVLLMFGCRDDPTGPAEYGAVLELTIVPGEVNLLAGQAFQLSVMIKDGQGRLIPLPPGDDVAWGSSDAQIAEVAADGTVLALADGQANISFMVESADFNEAKTVAEKLNGQLGGKGVAVDEQVGKVSVVGVGMRSHTGVAAKMFAALAEAKVNIQNISTSEIKISCIVSRDEADEALRCVHSAFDLDTENDESA